MKIRRKMLIDALCAFPVAFLLNWANLAHRALRPARRNPDRSFKTIAVCKFVGMGSVIQATPLFRALRKRFPESRIIFITTAGLRPLILSYGLVDQVICLDDHSLWTLLRSIAVLPFTLIRSRISVYINLETYSHFGGVAAALSLARFRIGFFRKTANNRRGIFTHLVHVNARAPIAQVYLQTARLIGCTDPDPSLPDLPADAAAAGAMHAALHRLTGGDAPYILVNPNASDLRIERRWPGARFTALIAKIRAAYPAFDILLVGAADERAFNESLVPGPGAGARIFNTAGLFPLGQFVELVRAARLIVTNDSGPMHLAAALRTPAVALFGPEAPEHYGIAGPAIVIYTPVYCSPCVHEFVIPPCRGDNHCMQSITVDQVFSAVSRQLEGSGPDHSRYDTIRYVAADGATPLGIVARS